jgi:hypothetical protein
LLNVADKIPASCINGLTKTADVMGIKQKRRHVIA